MCGVLGYVRVSVCMCVWCVGVCEGECVCVCGVLQYVTAIH